MYALSSTPIQSDQARFAAQATVARFVAASFCESVSQLFSQIPISQLSEELFAAARALGLNRQLIDKVISACATVLDEGEFPRILGHTVRSECPPYELEYRTAEVFQQSQTLADIAGFYRAFGFGVAGPIAERVDHVTTELEFLAALSMMAHRAGRTDDVECCIHARNAFLKDHAATWMPAFFERIRRAAPESFLAAVSDLADALVRQCCSEAGVHPGSGWLELRPIVEEDSSITCGAGGNVELGPVMSAALESRNYHGHGYST